LATQKSNVDYVVDQMAAAGSISARAMFGEYGIYCDGKIVALMCDDQLFVKPTKSGQLLAATCPLAPPYPGAKNYLLVDGDKCDDAEWLSKLVRLTAAELPMPKPKKPKLPKAKPKKN
jgi:TfoX/Sxy family transcriptional regulator of competence genes